MAKELIDQIIDDLHTSNTKTAKSDKNPKDLSAKVTADKSGNEEAQCPECGKKCTYCHPDPQED